MGKAKRDAQGVQLLKGRWEIRKSHKMHSLREFIHNGRMTVLPCQEGSQNRLECEVRVDQEQVRSRSILPILTNGQAGSGMNNNLFVL